MSEIQTFEAEHLMSVWSPYISLDFRHLLYPINPICLKPWIELTSLNRLICHKKLLGTHAFNCSYCCKKNYQFCQIIFYAICMCYYHDIPRGWSDILGCVTHIALQWAMVPFHFYPSLEKHLWKTGFYSTFDWNSTILGKVGTHSVYPIYRDSISM